MEKFNLNIKMFNVKTFDTGWYCILNKKNNENNLKIIK